MRLPYREVVAVFAWLGIDRSHGAIWNWTHMLSEEQANPLTVEPSRFDEKQIKIDGETKWLYAAIHTDSKHLLAIDVFSHHQNAPRLAGERELRSHQCRRTDPAAAFLHRLTRGPACRDESGASTVL